MFAVEFSGGMLLPIVTVASAQLSPVSSVSPDKEGMGGVECDQLIGAIVIVGNCCSFVVRLLLFGFTIVIPCGSGELWETTNGVKY